MPTTTLLAMGTALAVSASPLAPRPSSASLTSGEVERIAEGAIMLAAADVVLTVTDLETAFRGAPPSTAYGFVEVLLAAPQLALGMNWLSQSSGDANRFFIGYTAWMALLTVHGLWSIAAALSHDGTLPEVPGRTPPAPEEQPVLQLSFGPTCVPVGQLAHPGFGMIGRF